MRNLYKHFHEGVWFSENGHKAWMRGERPKCMDFGPDQIWEHYEPTCAHHIARPICSTFTRELVMFYREKKIPLTSFPT